MKKNKAREGTKRQQKAREATEGNRRQKTAKKAIEARRKARQAKKKEQNATDEKTMKKKEHKAAEASRSLFQQPQGLSTASSSFFIFGFFLRMFCFLFTHFLNKKQNIRNKNKTPE